MIKSLKIFIILACFVSCKELIILDSDSIQNRLVNTKVEGTTILGKFIKMDTTGNKPIIYVKCEDTIRAFVSIPFSILEEHLVHTDKNIEIIYTTYTIPNSDSILNCVISIRPIYNYKNKINK